MSGRVRPLLRYQAPSARRKRTGDVEMLFFAVGRSLPRGERPTPTTVIAGSTAFSVSYAAARYGPNAGADAFCPVASNCGRQNARLVRLVADHELLHLRVDRREHADVRGEERRRREAGFDLARRVRVDGEDDAEPRRLRARQSRDRAAACPG